MSMTTTLAYCFASGHIYFTEGVLPKGGLPLLRHEHAGKIVEGSSRRSYPDATGVTVPLVPGLPEAEGMEDRLAALDAYRDRLEAIVAGMEAEAARTFPSPGSHP